MRESARTRLGPDARSMPCALLAVGLQGVGLASEPVAERGPEPALHGSSHDAVDAQLDFVAAARVGRRSQVSMAFPLREEGEPAEIAPDEPTVRLGDENAMFVTLD